MHIRHWLSLGAGLFAATLSGASIDYQVTALGGNAFSYSYFLSGFAPRANQEVDIRFDPALYGALSNGAAGGGFSLLLLQPGNPMGTFGDYSALALADNPSLVGPFRVDFIFKGAGTPGGQPFFINQCDGGGRLIFAAASGSTSPAGAPDVPEPGGFLLGGAGLLLGGSLWALRRRS